VKNANFTLFVGFLGASSLFWSIYLVFGYAAVEETMLETQKIFYFHVSSAFVAFTAYAFTCVCSIIYLIRRDDKFDALGSSSAELGLVFCTVVLITGPIWGNLVELGIAAHKYPNSLVNVHWLFYFTSDVGYRS